MLADFILGKPVEGKAGWRYVRVPGQKRTYAVKTEADPSARFADWVNAGLLRIAGSSIRKVVINRYSIDETMGRLANMETTRSRTSAANGRRPQARSSILPRSKPWRQRSTRSALWMSGPSRPALRRICVKVRCNFH